ncbi:MAG: hypothetical protein ABW072_07955 [Sedimenticola sp.]
MKTIIDVLDIAHNYVPKKSDYGVAMAIGAKRQEVSMWRNGKGAPNAYYCSKLADLIGEDPQTVIAIVGANWEKNPERKAYWLEKLTGTAASIILLSSLLTLPSPADASAMEKPSKTVKNYIYIM